MIKVTNCLFFIIFLFKKGCYIGQELTTRTHYTVNNNEKKRI